MHRLNGIGTRNRRWAMLVEFAEWYKFKTMNTFFSRSDWTDGGHGFLQMGQRSTGKLQNHKSEFEVEIQDRFAVLALIPPDNLDSSGAAIMKRIHEVAISIAGRYKSEKPDKLSTGTKQLREKLRKRNRNGTPDKIEHSEIWKVIWWKMKEDIRKHEEKQIIEAIGRSKSLKQARHKQHLGKDQLISIMEDGTHIHDKDRTVKRCGEFYRELYRSRRASADQDSHGDPAMTSTIHSPSILPSGVATSLKRIKRNKALEEDNITGYIIHYGEDAIILILTDLFSTCLHYWKILKAWKNALIVLIQQEEMHQTTKTTEQFALFPLCTRCFQIFCYKSLFVG